MKMKSSSEGSRWQWSIGLTIATLALGALPGHVNAQADSAAAVGEWRYWGGDPGQSRYSPLDQINAENFNTLEQAWLWRGDNFGPSPTNRFNAVPLYIDGIVYTIAGTRRAAVAIDAGTGETLWVYREPPTGRWEVSSRKDWGKGLAYGEIDGRGIIYLTTPGYFLHAIDAKTGRPLEGFGKPVPVEGFGEYGTVDMLEYNPRAHPYDPDTGPAWDQGAIFNTAPPMVVNGVVIVGAALLDGGTGQTRIENVPGDILAFDMRTGEHLWSFHTVPLTGEFGAETWENGSNEYTGNAAAWAPFAADVERGIVYIPTEDPTNDYYGGRRLGDNLFANTLLALDVQTGERIWHFQIIHHDVWDWDLPQAPMLVDLTVDGEEIPAVVQVTKNSNAFAFNRVTGEPIWPIVETPVPASNVPGERLSPTQPLPTKPRAWELQGLTIDSLINFTPEWRAAAIEEVSHWKLGPLFNPPMHEGNEEGLNGSVVCPSFTGGTNATGGVSMDRELGIMFAYSVRHCSGSLLVPASTRDDGLPGPGGGRGRGATVTDWSRGRAGFGQVSLPGVEGSLSILKPPYGKITAIDMNTGEHLWWIPNGGTDESVLNNPSLQGLDIENTGQNSHAQPFSTKTLMIYGEGRGGQAYLHAVNKLTGEEVGVIELPAPTASQPMSFLHDGQQYIVVAIAGNGIPGSLVAYRLPQEGGGGFGGFGGFGGGN